MTLARVSARRRRRGRHRRRQRRPPPRRARLGGDRGRRPGAAVGDRRLDLARARAGLPAQRVAHDDAPGAVDGREAHRAGRLPPRGQHRGRHHRRALGRARPPLGAGARLRPRRAAARPRAGRRAAPAARSGDDPRRPARGRRRDRQGRARRAGAVPPRRDRGVRRLRGHGPADRGRPRRRRADGARDRSAPSTSSSPRASGGGGLATLAPGLNVPLVPVEHQLAYTAPLPELAGETREVVHPILRHQDHAMYFRQVRRRLRDRQLPPRAAPGRARAPGASWPSPPTTSPRRARRRAACCRRCATSRSRAPSTG